MFLTGPGLPEIRFHDLRAAQATIMLTRGIQPIKIMIQGGWKDLKAMQIYVRKAGVDIKGSTDSLELHNPSIEKVSVLQIHSQSLRGNLAMDLNINEKFFWQEYVSTLNEAPIQPEIEANVPGNDEIADELLELYLSGKKTAGSGLVKDYELAGDPLPKVDNYWIILDSKKNPKCIVKTLRVELYQFDQVPEEVAIAEGEGDLSLDYWRKGHIKFFTPFLKSWGIENLDKEKVVTEFYEVVYKAHD